MFADELDRIANRVSSGTKQRGYAATLEDDYSDEANADSTCDDFVYDLETPR